MQNRENISEKDGVLFDCRRDLQLFISMQEEQPFMIDEDAPEKEEPNTFSKLIYLQVAMLNNRGGILYYLGRERDAHECFELAYQQRQYDFSLDEERSSPS